MSLPGIETHCLASVAFDSQSRWLIAGGGGMTKRNGRSVTLRELIAWNIPDGDVRWQTVEEAKEGVLDDAEPDGLLFAEAINGDALCFDLRGRNQKYPVFHFDHETTRFEPFAADFASAIRRLVEGE
ncbi:MAG: SMI1/KNR4 family protein [Planctomycetaceae bacterium]